MMASAIKVQASWPYCCPCSRIGRSPRFGCLALRCAGSWVTLRGAHRGLQVSSVSLETLTLLRAETLAAKRNRYAVCATSLELLGGWAANQ
eukprot:8673675-Heterocapsa_arctica.AAC.1